MYTSIRQLGVREWSIVEAPSLTSALIIAELFYKFHSFALECVAFLATWSAISWAAGRVTGRRISRAP